MAEYDFDLFTIGAGSGGVASSRRAGSYGARVAICEDSRVGGTCVIRGCVPKKLLVYGAHFHDDFADAKGFGWTIPEPTFDWSALIAAKNKEIDRLNQIYIRLLRDSGVTLIEGRGKVVDAQTVVVGDKRYTAKHILVATGSRPHLLPVRGVEHAISSNEALDLPALPRRVVIVGGGYIAVEFAGIFNALGSEVSLLIRGDTVLRGFDQDVRSFLTIELQKRGIAIRSETQVSDIERAADGELNVLLRKGETIQADAVLMATGRVPNTGGLGLEDVGVKIDAAGAVVVDELSRTSVPNMYAVGDVTNRMNLTPVAIAEGRAFVETVFNDKPTPISHEFVPSAVFSQPPVASVGLSEAQARAQLAKIDVYVASFRPMKHTLSGRDERTMMKLIVDHATDRVVGAHMVGTDAAEIMQGVAIAIRCGATKAQFDGTVGIHPTAAEEFVTMRTIRPEPDPHDPS